MQKSMWCVGVFLGLLACDVAQGQVVGGSGTAGRIPRWTAANTQGDSAIFQSGTNLGIGTTTPDSPLTVFGNTGSVLRVDNSSTTANFHALRGTITSTTPGSGSVAVRGINAGTGSNGYGVYGSQNGSGMGVFGYAPSGRGVYGLSSTGTGVFGLHSSTGGNTPGVQGYSSSTSADAAGVIGRVTSTTAGSDSAGVKGINNGTTDYNGHGVYGFHAGNGNGVYGNALGTFGWGVFGEGGDRGVYGYSTDGDGVYGYSITGSGVYGISDNGYGVNGVGADGGVSGFSPSGDGVYGQTINGYAGWFEGTVLVNGTLIKPAGQFKIDHPLDPANKYLSHSFVESPDMLNIYNGNITTDAEGNATVTLPDYFTALNTDYRYQLTCIGQFAQAIVAREVEDNHFVIRTDKPNVKVSWQVTGIRNDAYARAHRIQVEEDKGDERGTYLHPELAGQPKEKGLTEARHPNPHRSTKGQRELPAVVQSRR